MNLNFIIFFLLLSTSKLIGQTKTEFEGKVFYKHSFKQKNINLDTAELIKSFGSSSIYSYKNGNFYWEAKGSTFQYEIYNSLTNLLVDKYENTDSLQKLDIFKKFDSIVSFRIKNNADTICGLVCNSISLLLQSTTDKSILKRTLFYSSKHYINPEHFKNYRSFGNNNIYALTNSLPLRIVLEFDGLPVEIVVNAEKIIEEKIPDRLFFIDESLIMK